MTVDEKEKSAPADAPVGELVARLSDDTVRLVRGEIRLARAEMIQKAKAAGLGAGLFGGVEVFAIYALGVLVAAAVIGLSIVVDMGRRSHRGCRTVCPGGRGRPDGKEGVRKGGTAVTDRSCAKHQRGCRRTQARSPHMSNCEGPGSVEPDSVEAVRSDIEATRTELVETVTELSDRLDPTKRVGTVTQSVSDSAKDVVEQAVEVTKDAATKAQDVAKSGARRGRQLSDGREPELIGVAVLVVGLVLVWRLWDGTDDQALYKPWGMLAGMIDGALAGALFKRVWKLLSGEEEAPTATDRSRGWIEIVLAAGLEGAVFGAVKAFVLRGGAASFEKATGTWPGKESHAD